MTTANRARAAVTKPAVDFDALYRDADDPWHIRHRWYERRKRALLLACLPQAQYRQGFEPGCGNGELTALLANRCASLLAADTSATGLALARRRLADCPHVAFDLLTVPAQWPAGSAQRFDLIVISEFGYYLDSCALQQLATQCAYSLTPDGDLVACHWRHPFAERQQETDAVHAAFAAVMPSCVVRHEEADCLLEVWSRRPQSVAQREGFA